MKISNVETFQGMYVALYSAYDEAGAVSPVRAAKLARYYVGKGLAGLYVGGSSGEGILQSVEERKAMLEAVLQEVRGELKIIVHVGANATADSVELSRHAEACGADAISAVPSIYYRLSEAAVENHWQQMIDAASLPFIIYNIPQTTGFSLSPSLCAKLAKQDKVIGVKMSGESTYGLQQLKAAGGEDFLVFNGPDEQFLAGRMMGADGGIGGTYGVMPELFAALYKLADEGRMKEARELQVRINSVISQLLEYPSLYGACKAILSLRGIETGQPRLPLLPASAADGDSLKALNRDIEEAVAEYATFPGKY
ncbi:MULTISPECIES: dihydrodipicolinate synthase family protein [unclassified Paenibacillus]|uniref:dihydrodipicolinate synthase family protein n=1 Tax=unclassified Paenibacillus TaxID=185978 RepID=UPI000955C062|nr:MULTISPECIES: dihydrodipicolinate synthase family protein [unclassified Paenibacillus]ASS66186.1 N-acetylneuraminate lyase [Paenibacillus sp. RUD330]SIQ10266.1 N-acetylneuraminate lyase [Paenibacillus sp. RU4X]SIQ30954.1 N-acetylneuraminate lyase [Paenibacillus sp. RU4T]